MSFEIGVLKIFAIFSGNELYWSLFFSYQKETPAQMLSCEYCEIFESNFFTELLRWLLLKGSIMHFFTGTFPDSGKLYQQLELEYLNQRSWWDVYVCFMVLLNVQYIMLNNFHKNPLWHPNLKYSLAEQNSSKCYFPSEVLALKVYFVMLHWILLGLLY